MKKLIITENQLYALKEMAYPVSFNMEEFKLLNTFSIALTELISIIAF